ncbi:MAG: hypothetical protein IKE63_04010 [Bacilli bacterium]|nr:hypothetical protein [Bacilli bacterium]
MIMLHKRSGLVYYHASDIKSIELLYGALNEYKTKIIVKLAGVRETVYVKESPTYILRRMGEETKNSN